MYGEVDAGGRRVHTAAEVAAAFSVSRASVYRYLDTA
jgi:predicted DNA-binding transcriptional regulator YafY